MFPKMVSAGITHHASDVSRLWQDGCKQRLFFLLAGCVLFAVQLQAANNTTATASDQSSDTENISLTWTPNMNESIAMLEEAMNKSVDPCTNFYQYSCGSYSKTHTPQDLGRLAKVMRHRLKGLLEKPYNESTDPKYFQNTKNFYQSCVDEDELRRLGAKPLLDLVEQLGPWPMMSNGSWNGSQDLETTLAELASINLNVVFKTQVDSDAENKSQQIIYLYAGGVSIPVEYLLGDRNSTVLMTYEQLYRDLAVHVLGLPPSDTLNQTISEVVDFEIELAQFLKLAEETVPEKVFLDEMPILFPKLCVTRYLRVFFERANVKLCNDSVITVLFDYVQNVTDLIGQTEKRVVFNYLLMRLVGSHFQYLSHEIRELDEPLSKALYGLNHAKGRWKACVQMTTKVMEEAVGSLYVSKYFSPAQKKQATETVEFFRATLKEVISSAQWMDNNTMTKALEKADEMTFHVGHPDYFLNKTVMEEIHEDMNFDPKLFFQNVLAIKSGEVSNNAYTLLLPPSNEEKFFDPTEVNAYYDSTTNAIILPAALFQPPYYGDRLTHGQMFGAFGMMLGHEMSHAFDNTGRFFDKKGNMISWLSNATAQTYETLASCFIDEYSLQNASGVRLNGKKTLNENIADNGGIKVSYKAFKDWQAKYGVQPQVPGPNLTNDQLFFISVAQLWCTVQTNEEAKTLMMLSSHSPEFIRTLTVMSNNKDFAKVFNCPVGSKMNPETKCGLW